MKSFKEISEKIVRTSKGEVDFYLLNPTASEIYAWYKKSKYKNLRGFSFQDNLYIWDGYDAIHVHFVADNIPEFLFVNYKKYGEQVEYRINIDPYHNDEGNFIGTKVSSEHKNTIQKSLQYIQRDKSLIQEKYAGTLKNEYYNDQIYVNPSPTEFTKYIQNSSIAIIVEKNNKNVYIWDGYGPVHDDVKKHFKFNENDICRLRGYYKNGKLDNLMFSEDYDYADDEYIQEKARIALDNHYMNVMLSKKSYEWLESVLEIKESRIKDPRITYLEDPSPQEFMGYLNRTQHKAVRIWKNPETGSIFVWDAFEYWHDEFVRTILDLDLNHTGIDDSGFIELQGTGTNPIGGVLAKSSKFKRILNILEKNNIEYVIRPIMNRELEYGELSERKIKDPRIEYLLNPTPREFFGYASRQEAVRVLISDEGDLYVWDAFGMLHQDFYTNILDAGKYHHNSAYVGEVDLQSEQAWLGIKFINHPIFSKIYKKIEGKLKIYHKGKYMNESFFMHFKNSQQTIPIFKNPSHKEIMEIINQNREYQRGNINNFRIIVDMANEDFYCFTSELIHHEVLEFLHKNGTTIANPSKIVATYNRGKIIEIFPSVMSYRREFNIQFDKFIKFDWIQRHIDSEDIKDM